MNSKGNMDYDIYPAKTLDGKSVWDVRLHTGKAPFDGDHGRDVSKNWETQEEAIKEATRRINNKQRDNEGGKGTIDIYDANCNIVETKSV